MPADERVKFELVRRGTGGTGPRAHLEECLRCERVCECEDERSIRVDFFPEVERDSVNVLVSAQGPDLLCFSRG